MPKPICFMIMPYGRKATQVEPSSKSPGEVNFNALWDRAFAPTIRELGYEPVRADQDTGALIINQMLERLYFADLVLADLTIPNGNVYYEVGIRHAAQRKGCVLFAAEWSKPLFDVAQMRTVRYPMREGNVTGPTAAAIKRVIRKEIPKRTNGVSPMHEAIKGYPDKVDKAAASTMKGVMSATSAFQGDIIAVRAVNRKARMARAKKLVAKYWKPPVTPSTILALLLLLKDSAEASDDWSWIHGFIGELPKDIAVQEEVRELDAFALANAGKPIDAIARLEALIADSGATPERCGILGGRYKRLHSGAEAPSVEQMQYLAKSIEAYERGMELDLNQYYCSGNLPRLYRARKRDGDDERARTVSAMVVVACERARKLGVADEWLRATLLGAAFDAADADKAKELAQDVAAEGAAKWKLESTLEDLRKSVAQVDDKERRLRLAAILTDLEKMSG